MNKVILYNPVRDLQLLYLFHNVHLHIQVYSRKYSYWCYLHKNLRFDTGLKNIHQYLFEISMKAYQTKNYESLKTNKQTSMSVQKST